MSKKLDVIIVDDDPSVCKVISNIIKSFYIWGEVISFTDIDEAIAYCMGRDMGVAVFVLDIYLGDKTGFDFLDQIVERFPFAREDTIIITGNASNEVVNRCISSDVTHLLEKPIRSYALQLAVRAIVMKYVKFAKRLRLNPTFAAKVKILISSKPKLIMMFGNNAKSRDIGKLILRIGIGLMFIWHGWPKVSGGVEKWEKLGGAMQNIGINFIPVFWGFMGSVSEFIGGILFLVGFYFRISSLFMFMTMLVAVSMHLGMGDGLMGAAHAIELSIVFLAMIWIGPGRFSVDGK